MDTTYYDKLIEAYKLMIETQSSNFNLLIGVVLFIFAALLGINWFLNKTQITNKIKELESKYSGIRETINNDMVNFYKIKEKEIVENFLITGSKIDILTAGVFQGDNKGGAIYFLSRSIHIFNMMNSQVDLMNGVNLVIQYINSEPLKTEKKIYNLEEVKNIISKLPELLRDKRTEILTFLDQCTTM